MPAAVPHACAAFGCPNTANTCPSHGRRARQRQYDDRRGSAASRGYDATWEAYRAAHEARCFALEVSRAGLCGARLPAAPRTTDSLCAQRGLIVAARVLDHIQPIHGKDDPRRLDDSNMQWLCDPCHQRKRQRESLGGAGGDYRKWAGAPHDRLRTSACGESPNARSERDGTR